LEPDDEEQIMNVRNRVGLAITTAALGALGLLGLAGCSATPSYAGSLSPEQTALTATGFTADDVTTTTAADPTTDPSAAPGGNGKHPRLKRLAIRKLALRGKVEHGQVTVETKTGDQTIDVQRGTVTAINSTSMTVKSADGYTLTWTIGGPLKVIEARTQIQPSDVKVGELVGVAGLQAGANATAQLVVIPNKPAVSTGS
jgi:hypothetical protein